MAADDADRVRRDAAQRRLGVGMRGVLERDDGGRGIRIMIAHAPDERRHRPGGGIVDGGEVRVEVERLGADRREAHGAHRVVSPAQLIEDVPRDRQHDGHAGCHAAGRSRQVHDERAVRVDDSGDAARQHPGGLLGGAAPAELLGDARHRARDHAERCPRASRPAARRPCRRS